LPWYKHTALSPDVLFMGMGEEILASYLRWQIMKLNLVLVDYENEIVENVDGHHLFAFSINISTLYFVHFKF
jgi:hypothetical protein